MAPAPQYSFRYEPELCTLAEGQTLTQWRVEGSAGDRLRRDRVWLLSLLADGRRARRARGAHTAR